MTRITKASDVRRIIGIFWALLLLCVHPALGQTSASLRGSVSDPSGAALPNASVHLVSGNNSQRTATTDEHGGYVFQDVAPGTFELSVEAIGFETYQQADVHIQANAAATVDVKMKISQVEQTVTVTGQTGECIVAQARVLPDAGPGLRAIREGRSGNFYVLTAFAPTVAIFSQDGKKIGQMPTQPSADSSIKFGTDLDVDSSGRVYVADRGANAIKMYSPDGAFAGEIPVAAPIPVAALPDGEVAVASLLSKHLVEVYDARGSEIRGFGDMSDSGPAAGEPSLTNRGWFHGDPSGSVYFNLAYLPEPTIRKYDRYGYAAYDITLPSDPSDETGSQNANKNWDVRFRPEVRIAGIGTISSTADSSQSGGASSTTNPTSATERMAGGIPTIGGPGMRGGGMREGSADGGTGEHPGGFRRPGVQGLVGVMQLTQRGSQTDSKVQFDALGVEPGSQEVWAAIGGNLIHFDNQGNPEGFYCLNTANQKPVKPTTIIVEPNRILLGIDPFGIFEYARPDK